MKFSLTRWVKRSFVINMDVRNGNVSFCHSSNLTSFLYFGFALLSSQTYRAVGRNVLHCCRFSMLPFVRPFPYNVQVWNRLRKVIVVSNFVGSRLLVPRKVPYSTTIVRLLQSTVGRTTGNLDGVLSINDFLVYLFRPKFVFVTIIGQCQEMGF